MVEWVWDLYALCTGLRIEYARDALKDLSDVELVRSQGEHSRLHLLHVKKVVHKALDKVQLTHHKISVFGGLLKFQWLNWLIKVQDVDDLFQKEDYREQWRAHLVGNSGQIGLLLLFALVHLLSLQMQNSLANLLTAVRNLNNRCRTAQIGLLHDFYGQKFLLR